ncbi:MAG: ParB/RepB/Spo0J family partition protein [Pseudomonadota bacterium]
MTEPGGAASTGGAIGAGGVESELRELPIELIERGQYQPRREFAQEALQELADSIKSQGLMQPIVVRPVSDGKFEIIAGERRWRATQLAGLPSIASLVRDVPDEAAIAMALIENIQREDLNPIEEAVALARLQEEFGLTQQEVADAVGKSRSSVANLLRLNSLEPEVRNMLADGAIDMGHGRALLALQGGPQRELATLVVAKGFSVRQTEAAVRAALQGQETERVSPSTASSDPNIQHLEQQLSQKLGSSVSIRHTAAGNGSLVLKYNSLDELDGILSHLR